METSFQNTTSWVWMISKTFFFLFLLLFSSPGINKKHVPRTKSTPRLQHHHGQHYICIISSSMIIGTPRAFLIFVALHNLVLLPFLQPSEAGGTPDGVPPSPGATFTDFTMESTTEGSSTTDESLEIAVPSEPSLIWHSGKKYLQINLKFVLKSRGLLMVRLTRFTKPKLNTF